MAVGLERRVGTIGAVLLGLGSMVGTGVFVSLGLAAADAMSWLPFSIVVAALVATCNATSSAQLAAAHPVAGGTYEYGHAFLHPIAGVAAGWLFLAAKSASAAAAALSIAAYLLEALDPLTGISLATPQIIRGAAVTVCLALTLIAALGIERSSRFNAVVVIVTILALLVFVLGGLSPAAAPLAEGDEVLFGSETPIAGIAFAAAMVFVAYTGYGRIATLGEEVRDPQSTIPRAILWTVGIVCVIYLGVAMTSMRLAGPAGYAEAASGGAPLELIARRAGLPVVAAVVVVGAATAMVGVLLNLLLGLSRVLLAMGRRGDAPGILARIAESSRAGRRLTVPRTAVLVTGIGIAVIVLVGGIGGIGAGRAGAGGEPFRGTIGISGIWAFSAAAVLIYYATTNLAALVIPADRRRYPRVLGVVGLAGCLGLAAFIPARTWIPVLITVAAGLALRAIMRISGGMTERS